MIKRPDKQDNIRIEALPNGPQEAASARPKPNDGEHHGKRSYKEKSWKDKPRQDDKPRREDKPRHDERPRDASGPRHDGKPAYAGKPKFEGRKTFEGKPKFEPRPRADAGLRDPNQRFDTKRGKAPYVAKAKRDGAPSFAKPAFNKKSKKNKNRG
jgi:ATP-dependent RNA helicase DeaD